MLILFRARWMFLFAALFSFTLLAGCGGNGTDGDHDDDAHHDDEHADHDADGHEDGDDDHPEHGPNGGHIVVFDDGKHHAEWIDEEDEKVIVLMLDDKKESTTIPAEAKVTITTTPMGPPPSTFALLAVDPSDGKASRFESSDKKINIEIGIAHDSKGTIMLAVELDGKTINAKLVPHKH